MNRRHFLTSSAALASGMALSSCSKEELMEQSSPYEISLAQWSNHRELKSGRLDNLDWPEFTKNQFDIYALEWVNQFFAEKSDHLGLQPKGGDYLAQMKQRCDDNGMKSLLIMCDGVGQIGDPDPAKRKATVEGHLTWLDAAKQLGCHSIRVNSGSDAKLPPEEQAKLCTDGLRSLSEHAAKLDLNVIVENHGGLSSHGAWLAGVLKAVEMVNCGSLPDFGNFYVVKKHGNAEQYEKQKALYTGVDDLTEDEVGLGYDRYRGFRDLMPYAKGVSAKSHDFLKGGEEAHTDFGTMMQIIQEAGYMGYIGIEYEGEKLNEVEGIMKTKALLEKVIAAV
ncbi:TIM barrel protein [Haloferula sp.]|uniref:TIM barrel protein n=1 Tax=Haloferula sp. TaxID=2497595 RepID=UPI003C7265C4